MAENNKYVAIIADNSAEIHIKTFNNEAEARKFLNNSSNILYCKWLIKGEIVE